MTNKIYRFILQMVVAVAAVMAPAATLAADQFVLVLDAGHGGKDTGAIDNGVKEKDINLGVALKLGELVKKKLKDVKVVYTRDNDSYLTLQERADKANKSKGNLFISIHTNSVDKNNKNRMVVAGTSVYALGLHKDAENMGIARRENAVIELEKDYKQKYRGFDPNSDESYIIFEMAQKRNLSKSIHFADMAQKQMVSKAGRRDRGVHQAGFWVLWATSMPAVLVELDFICNPNSAKYLASEQGQTQLAEALFEAVKSYVNSNKASAQTAAPEPSAEKEVLLADVVSDESGAVATAPVKSDRKVSDNRGKTSAQARPATRRRRNDAAKTASDARDVSTDEIPVRPASRPLPVETVEVAAVPAKPESEMTKSERKAKQKAEAQAKKRAEEEARKLAREEKRNQRQHRGKIARLKTVYKIQICASEELLKQSDPRFCGLKPISYYRENNLYKYTYGETGSEEEINKLLKEVKKKIPDAFIIKSVS